MSTLVNGSATKSYRVQRWKVLGDTTTPAEPTIEELTERGSSPSEDSFSWTNYPTLHEINIFLKKMSYKYPSTCSAVTIGRTLNKKSINLLKISNGNQDNAAILIDGGTHGREWTSVLSALYFIDSIARNFTMQPEHIKIWDWYIIPVLNPDGYEYSMTKDRLWRKNLRNFSGECDGVDLNRNFDYNWCQKGSSKIICSHYYCGPKPFSEEETRAFKRLVEKYNFSGYVSLHSSGSKVLYPWTPKGTHHSDFNTHLRVTRDIALAMRKIDNYQFTNGNADKMGLEKGSGMAIDWMFFVKEIKHSYVIETRGPVGLDLIEVNEMLPAVKEVRAGRFRFAELI